MANITYLTSSMITNKALDVLGNNLSFGRRVNTNYGAAFGVAGAKIGTTLNVRLPVRYIVTAGPGFTAQDFVETQGTVTLSDYLQVALSMNDNDLLLSVDEFSDRVLKPGVMALANEIDRLGLLQYLNIPYCIGTPGTIPTSADTYGAAKAQLDDNAAPMDEDRFLCLTPKMEQKVVTDLRGLFHSGPELDRQYLKGRMGNALGWDWSVDQNIAPQVVGPLGGTPAVNLADQTGSQLNTKNWTNAAAARLNVGDVITIAGVYQVNPQSRLSNGNLQQFVVTAAFSSLIDGTGTINISPPIVPPAAGLPVANQTVDSSPADGALISVYGQAAAAQAAIAGKVSPQALGFHRDAFTLASADLEVPKGIDMGSAIGDKELGVSIRFTRAWNPNGGQYITRLDALVGWATLRKELAVRICA